MQLQRTIATGLFIATLVFGQSAKRTRRPPVKAPAAAPAKVSATQSLPLSSIEVHGNKEFSEAEVVRLTGLEKGMVVGKAEFDVAQQKLLDSGLFETVAYRYNPSSNNTAWIGSFEVKEITQVYPYRFEAIDFPEAEMREWLRKDQPLYRDRIPPTAGVLKSFSESITRYLATKNKPIDVAGKLIPNAKGDMEVLFQPSSLPAVAQVDFVGNHVISIVNLRQGITGAGIGALYTENRFRQILEASIRPLYEALGYVRVSFPKIETSPATDVKGLVVRVHVNEGPVFKLGDVKIIGDMAEDRRILKEGSFRSGEVVDMKAIGEGAKRIEHVLRRRGYLNAEAKVDRTVDDKAREVNLTIKLDAGPQYRMGKLDIQGLDITSEPQIRKMWSLKEKAPFDFDYPDNFLGGMSDILDNLGRTRSKVTPDPGTLTVDVLLTFAPPEKKPEDKRKRRDSGGTSQNPVQFPLR